VTFVSDQRPWAVEHHFDGVDSVLASPAGVNHLGFNQADAQWLHLKQAGQHARITAGEAIMLRPADIDLIIKISWGWAHEHPGHPRGLQLSDEIGPAAKAVLMHFAQAAR
jgi:hypothetical protein